jgi:hypothetical protein
MVDRPGVLEVRLDDTGYILDADPGVPGALGVDHQHRPPPAEAKATAGGDLDPFAEPLPFHLTLQLVQNLFGPLVLAIDLVLQLLLSTDKNVVLIWVRHVPYSSEPFSYRIWEEGSRSGAFSLR